MPPSIQQRGNRPSIELKNFTDREPQREILARQLSLKPGQPLPVLHFYGVGGICKSWLLELWRRSINDPKWLKLALYPHIPVGFINLEKAGLDEAANLHRVRTEFAAVPCPRFDTAYAWLRFKQGQKDEPGVKGSGLAGNIVELVGEVASGAADGVPLVGKMAKWVAKRVKKNLEDTALEKWLLSKSGQDDFLRLRGLTADQLYGDHGIGQKQTLATRLRDDLHENLADHKSDYACRGVLFLDTFEVLRRGNSSSIHADMREEWVRDLHSTDGRLLIVSAGQNRLRWDECDADYRDERYMEQHLLGGLSADDATLFLGKCGVSDALLRNAVLKASVDLEAEGSETSYHPASLGICADAIQIETERGIAVDPATFDFPAGDWLQLSTRFLKSLPDDEERAWVQKLALPPRFDETAACAMSSRPDTAGKILTSVRYSFIRDDDEDGWYLLHGRMREALNRVQKTAALTKKQSQWRSHWQSRSQNDTDDFAALAWFHRYQLEPSAASDEWKQRCEAKRVALDMVAHFELLRWWEPIGLLTAKHLTTVVADFLQTISIEFWESTIGNRGKSIRYAIECYNLILTVRTKETFPQDWAMTQNNLGIAYSEISDGKKGTNLRSAIDCYNAAITVYTKEGFPQDWAMIQNNLGNAYVDIPDEDQRANLRFAIDCYHAALTVGTKETFPQDWAMTQNNLGIAYKNIHDGERGVNLRSAVACFKAALTVFSNVAFHRNWAATQNNLGNAYLDMLDGDRRANLRSAIDCYRAALTVRTKEAFPQDWATTQNNLGIASKNLPDGDRSVNLRSAIDCYHAALTVCTEESFPHDWAWTQFNLGLAHEAFAEIEVCYKHLQQAEAHFVNAEVGFTTAGITMHLPTVRDELTQVRAKLAQLETEGGSES